MELPSMSAIAGDQGFKGEAMTRSLPVRVPPTRPAAPVLHGDVGRPSHARLTVLNASRGVMRRILPHLADAVKRRLLDRGMATLHGNTLDTTLQLMLAAQRSSGVNGL